MPSDHQPAVGLPVEVSHPAHHLKIVIAAGQQIRIVA